MYSVLLLAALAAAPAKAKPDPVQAADAWVNKLCRTYAADPTNPWALAHGIGAYGAGFKASDGRLAADVIVDDFVEKVETPQGTFWGFAPKTKADKPLDPHSDHSVAILLHSGLPLMRVFKTKSGDVTLGELAESIKRIFAFESTDDYWRQHPWTVDAVAAITRERSPKWTSVQGNQYDMNQVADAAVAYLKDQHKFLADAKASGVAMVSKARAGQKQYIWQHPCGGLHLMETAFAWATQPGFKKRHLADAEQTADILFYRLEVETRLYDDTENKVAGSNPELVLNINVQRLKFYGHWLDAMMRLHDLGLWKTTPRRRELVQAAREMVAKAVDGLKADGAGDRMEEFRTGKAQVFLDLIGDSCHAVTGLRESKKLVN